MKTSPASPAQADADREALRAAYGEPSSREITASLRKVERLARRCGFRPNFGIPLCAWTDRYLSEQDALSSEPLS